jgi:hypothetical protein
MKKYGIWILGAAVVSVAMLSYAIPSFARSKSTKTERMQTTWGKLGQGWVEPADNGMTTINAQAGKPVHAIKIKVLNGGVNLHRCEVWFNDGSKKSIELRNDVPAGSESREMGLNEGSKQVSKIVFWYDTRNYGKQGADVELWGKKVG